MANKNGGFIGTDGLDAPDPPTAVTPTAGDAEVSVAFTAPTDTGTSAITGFVAQVSTDGTNYSAGSNTGTSSPIVVSSLTNDTAATAKVWAINAYGTSAPSDASASFTPEQPQLGLSFGGDPDNNSAKTNRIEFINIGTTGNASDFGDLTQSVNDVSGASSSTRGLRFGGDSGGTVNVIDYVTMRSAGNATDYGDLTTTRYETAAFSNSTRWLCTGSQNNAIDYGTIASTGNASDFGDRTQASGSQKKAGCASTTRGIFGGGSGPTNAMEYVTINSTGNTTDFGDLDSARQSLMGCSSNTKGFFMGGASNSAIEYVTISSTGNAQSWGSLGSTRQKAGATSSTTRGVIFGGEGGPVINSISYFDIASSSDISDFGDLAAVVRTNAGCGTNHGGIA